MTNKILDVIIKIKLELNWLSMKKMKIKTFLVMVSDVFLSLFLFTDSVSVEEKVNINDLDQLSIDLITEAE